MEKKKLVEKLVNEHGAMRGQTIRSFLSVQKKSDCLLPEGSLFRAILNNPFVKCWGYLFNERADSSLNMFEIFRLDR